ncbi:hypothetical protein TIFTF001_032749 [Ficus carica]|uniref:Uncharacterized protein n=1 Tax=Ficus carica TaxID=3494 RepID=A0AA88E0U6_FICCA|nr:hypothetical protein TIFTF001_032749 [Ficus carica]
MLGCADADDVEDEEVEPSFPACASRLGPLLLYAPIECPERSSESPSHLSPKKSQTTSVTTEFASPQSSLTT